VAERFLTEFNRFFPYGLAAVLPTLLTLAILVHLFGFLDKYLATHVNAGVQWVLIHATFRKHPAPPKEVVA
jgi:uncharacterized membrane protein